jgi:hypothetical protein
MDVSSLKVDLGPDNLDPVIEKQADQFGRTAWQLEFKPVMEKFFDRDLTVEEEAKLQNLLFETKYNTLLTASTKRAERSKLGKRW